MLHQITFGLLSARVLDFVDHRDGFLYLRMVGPEVTVNAIWATLSAREGRGKKWTSQVEIAMPGNTYPERVAAQKGVTYRTLRARLPNGLLDVALIHPLLTVAEDTERGFYLLTYDEDVPAGFFARLNHTLSIPLKPDWATWLWQQGQQPQSWLAFQTRPGYEDSQPEDQKQVVELTRTPITCLDSLGEVSCYQVRCAEDYRAAWLQIIRTQLQLGTILQAAPHPLGGERYADGRWTIEPVSQTDETGWQLTDENEIVSQAPSLNHLLVEARESLGVHFIIEKQEKSDGPLES